MRKTGKLWLTRISQLFGSRSKKDMVLEWLQDGNTITQRDAIKYFNSYRLADIVFRLKKDGYLIENVNNTGRGKFAEYKLEGVA